MRRRLKEYYFPAQHRRPTLFTLTKQVQEKQDHCFEYILQEGGRQMLQVRRPRFFILSTAGSNAGQEFTHTPWRPERLAVLRG